MDLSGLIFVALAVAWAAYLVPKALRHHDDVASGRSIDRFSSRLRVLAHREPVSSRRARLVVTATPQSAAAPLPELGATDRLRVSARATRRRRRVLSLLLAVLVAVVAVCATGRLAWGYVAVPAVLLVAWLVACRLMVRSERSPAVPARVAQPDETPVAEATPAPEGDQPVVRDPQLWDPVPTTLPTYVSKPPARRSVRTIDLDSTGVWTSGRTDADSALAREADAAERVRRHTARKDPGAASSAG